MESKLHSFQWVDDVKGLGTNKATYFSKKKYFAVD